MQIEPDIKEPTIEHLPKYTDETYTKILQYYQ